MVRDGVRDLFTLLWLKKDDAPAKGNAVVREGIRDLFTLLRVKKMTHPDNAVVSEGVPDARLPGGSRAPG